MAERQQAEQREDRGLVDRIREMLGLAEPQAVGSIVQGLDISRLIDYVLAERPAAKLEEEPDEAAVNTVRGEVVRVEAISRELIDVFVRDGLSRIYHPLYGDANLQSRLGVLAQLLAEIVRAVWRRARESLGDPNARRQMLVAAEAISRRALLVLVEMYNKMTTIYYVNAPAQTRPPLANVSLGFDIIGPTILRREEAESGAR